MIEDTSRLSAALADRYKMQHRLGEGGMATVYLAEDIKHDRKVAIKVLRPELAAVIGAERFLSEIKTTANLQHPHILPLHDSGEADSFLFYVMPYVGGESLADRLAKEQQLPVDEAVRIASEVGLALDYAHRQGVIHRDIKPDNILLHDGSALVADFGIALAVSSAGGTRMTETGLSLGTPHYMSPEQAMGEREINAKSDVYALGCVLYEMLVGEPPFTGPSAQAIMARVMTEDPRSITAQRKTVPVHVETTVHRSLAKIPADRQASAADFVAQLREPGRGFGTRATAGKASPVQSSQRPSATMALALLSLVLALLAVWGWIGRAPADPVSLAYQIHLTPSESSPAFLGASVAISPAGDAIVFSDTIGGVRQLWIKERDDPVPVPIAGTRDGEAPFFSPDGEWIAYTAGTRLMKIARTGGAATVLSDSGSTETRLPGGWLDEGTVVFLGGSADLVFTVPENGGATTLWGTFDDLRGYPVVISPIPGRRAVLVTVCEYGTCANPRVVLLELDSPSTTPVVSGASGAWLLPSQRVIYVLQDGSAFVADFDAETAALGPGQSILNGVAIGEFGAAMAVSLNGTVLYTTGSGGGNSGVGEFVAVSESTEVRRLDPSWSAQFDFNTSVNLSPDGLRAVASIAVRSDGSSHVFIKDLPDGPALQFTSDGTVNIRPAWTPDGRGIAWVSDRGGHLEVWQKTVDGAGEPRLLVTEERDVYEVGFSPDGDWVVYRTNDVAPGRGDIYARRLNGDSSVVAVAVTDAEETSPAISPDGRWIAYSSRVGERKEVFVRPFPNARDAVIRVSVEGGSEPLWSRDGETLYYRMWLQDRVDAARLEESGGGLTVVGRTTVLRLPTEQYRNNDDTRTYARLPDGSFFMIRWVAGDEADEQSRLILREGWLAGKMRDRQ